MIKEILIYIYKNNDFDTKNIAKNLSLNEELVEKTKENLIKKGYLKFEEKCSQEKCKMCNCDCSSKKLNEVKTIIFTEKAMNILKKAGGKL